ncbi:MFS transporter [Streptomyces achromogenes]|uniref:MFS transporter n=1 Tax=Streptomyces achromogenes TaxID=67255 RepID=UPI00369C6133
MPLGASAVDDLRVALESGRPSRWRLAAGISRSLGVVGSCVRSGCTTGVQKDPSHVSTGRPESGRPAPPLAIRPYRLHFTARLLSWTGSAVAPIGLAFAVLRIGGGPGALGTVLAASAVPQILLLLVGGVAADRLPRDRVMVWSNVVCAVAEAAAVLLLVPRAGHVRGQDLVWRSSYGAVEDRNTSRPTTYGAAASAWRSPFGATEDRNVASSTTINVCWPATRRWKAPS